MLRITVEQFQYSEKQGSFREEVLKRQVTELIGSEKDSAKVLAAVGAAVALIDDGQEQKPATVR